MKATPALRKWVEERCKKFCAILDVPPPTVLLTAADIREWGEEHGWSDRNIKNAHARNRKYLGVCFSTFHNDDHRRMIYINAKIHRRKAVKLHGSINSRWRYNGGIEGTLAHELIHYARPSYRHGSKFEQRVAQLLWDYHRPPTNKCPTTEDKIERIKARLKSWETKRKRADTYIKKLTKELSWLDRKVD